jgi:hypothetical protein
MIPLVMLLPRRRRGGAPWHRQPRVAPPNTRPVGVVGGVHGEVPAGARSPSERGRDTQYQRDLSAPSYDTSESNTYQHELERSPPGCQLAAGCWLGGGSRRRYDCTRISYKTSNSLTQAGSSQQYDCVHETIMMCYTAGPEKFRIRPQQYRILHRENVKFRVRPDLA